MNRTVRVAAFGVGALALSIGVGRAIAQEARTEAAAPVVRPLIEGLAVRTRVEPSLAPQKLSLIKGAAAAILPTCTSVAPAATVPAGPIPGTALSADYWESGCHSLVVDFVVPLGVTPHFDFGAMIPPQAQAQATVGGISSPSDEAGCEAYEENARFWWKPVTGNDPWEFVYAASIEGRFVNGACRLFAKDADSRFAHQKWQLTSQSFRLRVALEAHVGDDHKPVRIQGMSSFHFHPMLPQ